MLSVYTQSYAEKYSFYIDKKDLNKHLSIIASDSFLGRATGMKGQQLTANYIANQYKKTGLKKKETTNGFFQNYTIIEAFPSGEMTVNQEEYSFFRDFLLFEPNFFGSVVNDVELLYISEDVSEKEINKISFENKLILLTGREIDDFDNIKLEKEYNKYKSLGASGVLFLSKTYHSLKNQFQEEAHQKYRFLERDVKQHVDFPLIFGNEEIFNKLDLTKKERKRYDKNKSLKKPIALGKLSLSLNTDTTHLNASNVIGYIPGEDSLLKNETVVVMAHHDHLGVLNDKIYNGADDNGSGTVALLEIAEAFSVASSQGHAPKRTIAFVSFSGEEIGLLGSRFYSKNPIFPMQKTIAALNIDMIGRVNEDSNSVFIIGSDFISEDLHTINEKVNQNYLGLNLDYTYNSISHPDRLFYRSDHYHFAKHEVPSIFYFGGFHDDYHQPTDTIEKIDFEKLEKTTKLVYYCLWDIANREQPLTKK